MWVRSVSLCKHTNLKLENSSLIVVNAVANYLLAAVISWWMNIETNNSRWFVANADIPRHIGKICKARQPVSDDSCTLGVPPCLLNNFPDNTRCFWLTCMQRQNINTQRKTFFKSYKTYKQFTQQQWCRTLLMLLLLLAVGTVART